MFIQFLATISLVGAAMAPNPPPSWPLSPPYPWSDGVEKSRVELVNVMAIVKVTGQSTVANRTTLPSPKGAMFYATVPVTVESGLGCTKGEVLKAVYPHYDFLGSPLHAPSFNPDKRYLLVGLQPERERLRFPVRLVTDLDRIIVECTATNEVATVMLLETTAKEVPTGDTILQRLYPAVIDCMKVKDDEVVRQACRFLRLLPPGNKTRKSALPYGGPTTTTYCPEDDTVRAVRALVEKAAPYRRSLIWGLLLRWRVPGSLTPYTESLEALLNIPGPYSHPIDSDELITDLENYRILDGSCWIESEKYVNLVTNTKNDILLKYFLRYHGGILSDSQCVRFAQLLRNRDIEVRYWVVEGLALITGEKDHSVLPYKFENGQRIQYPNLDREVAYWMERYGMRP